MSLVHHVHHTKEGVTQKECSDGNFLDEGEARKANTPVSLSCQFIHVQKVDSPYCAHPLPIAALDMRNANPWSRLPSSEYHSLQGVRSWVTTCLRATSETRLQHLPAISEQSELPPKGAGNDKPSSGVCVCVRVCVYACVCMCACIRTREPASQVFS
eukprot:scaffold139220_cov21-Tisochrysis_lutea.AAC.4